MSGSQGCDRVQPGLNGFIRHDPMKNEPFPFSSEGFAGCFNLSFYSIISVHLHLSLICMGKWLPQQFEILRITMIGMTVGEKEYPHFIEFKTIIQCVQIIIRRQIQQQVIIDQRL